MKCLCNRVASFFLSFLFPAALVHAQLSDIKFRHLDVHNGLPSNIVTSIVKDSLGYIWVGTKNGLCRYDGTKFFVYRHDYNDSNSLKGNEITSLVPGKHNQLWIGTNSGVCRFDYRTNKFYNLTIPQYLAQKNNSVAKIFLQDKDGYLWLYEYAYKSLLGYNPEKHDYKILDFFVGNTSGQVYNMFEDIAGDLWFSYLDSFYRYRPKIRTFDRIKNPERNSDASAKYIITAFAQGDDNSIWMTSWGSGLVHYNMVSGKAEHYLIEPVENVDGTRNVLDYPKWIRDRTSGKMLIWITAYGLSNFDTSTKKFISYPTDIYNPYSSKLFYTVSNFPGSYYDDEQNILWCWGPFGIDICDFNSQTIQTFHTLSEKNKVETKSANGFVNSLRNNNNEYFLGNFVDRKIFIYNEAERSIKEHSVPFIDKGISRIFQPDSDRIWMSIESEIWEWNQITDKVSKITSQFGKDNDEIAKGTMVYRYFKDSRGTMWLGTDGGGLCRFDPVSGKYQWRNRVVRQGTTTLPSPGFITAFAEAKEGSIYALDKTKGLFKLTGDGVVADLYTPNPFVSTISHHKSLPSKYLSMARDAKDILWICTNEGLISFDVHTVSFSAYPDLNSVANSAPTRIAIDKHGYIWLTYTNSLLVFNPQTNKSRLFNYKNGFEGSPDDCNLLINSNGDLRVAYANHIESISGDPFESGTDTMPKVLITQVQSGNRIVNVFDSAGGTNLIHVGYKDNSLFFEFALPLYHAPDDIIYYYSLDGFDKSWINAGNTHLAKYTNLPGGDYEFRVKAFDPLSGKFSAVTTVGVVAHPPFWKTWWFVMLSVLATASLFYTFYRYRLQQLLKLEKMRTSISSDLHDEVGATLSSISIYSNVARRMADLDKERSREYLDKIEISSREMIDSMGDIVWSINPANDDPGKMMQRMRSYAYEILGAAEIELHWKENNYLEKQKMTMEQRKNFYLFFKEGINNAAKYSKAKDVFVELDIAQQQVLLRIKDTGIGFNKQAHRAGNGLKNMQLRSKILKGTFRLTSAEDAGTELVLTFPL